MDGSRYLCSVLVRQWELHRCKLPLRQRQRLRRWQRRGKLWLCQWQWGRWSWARSQWEKQHWWRVQTSGSIPMQQWTMYLQVVSNFRFGQIQIWKVWLQSQITGRFIIFGDLNLMFKSMCRMIFIPGFVTKLSSFQAHLAMWRRQRLRWQERRRRLQEDLLNLPVLLRQWKMHQRKLSVWQRQWLRRWQWWRGVR